MSTEKYEMMENKMKKDAERYYEKYKPQMEALEGSLLKKVRGGSLNVGDYYALGKQLEQYDAYASVCEEEGNTNLLGKIPTIAYDVITAVAGVSIIPVVAAVQPVDEERGTVYFKTIRSATTKGSQTAGDVVVDPRKQIVTPQGYSSNFIEGESVHNTGATPAVTATFTLAAKPVRSESVRLTMQDDSSVFAIDDGRGKLVGAGLSGTIDYLTGVCNVRFAVAPAANKVLFASYQVNPERAIDLPQIDTYFDSKTIQAKVYALKGTIGLLQSYGMRKRFGLIAEDELAKDLVAEINREIGGDLVRTLKAVAVGSTQFDKLAPAGVSYFEHKQTFKDAIAGAESVLVGQAGRGTVSLIIAGRKVCSIIQTLPGFEKLTDGSTLGTHVFGKLDGITIVRVTEDSVLAANKALVCWKGQSPFEAPVVYAPYMPLVVTSTLPVAPNPLQQMKAAAVWAGIESLVPNFVTNLEVLNA